MKMIFPKILIDWHITSLQGPYTNCQFCAIAILNDESEIGLIAQSPDDQFKITVDHHPTLEAFPPNKSIDRADALVRVMGEMGGPAIKVDREVITRDALVSDRWRWSVTNQMENVSVAHGTADSRQEAVKIAAAFVAGMNYQEAISLNRDALYISF